METTKQTNLDEILKCLNSLKFSPIGNGDYVRTLLNLSDTIKILTVAIYDLADDGGRLPTANEQIIELSLQIETLSKLIKQCVSHEDMATIQALISSYAMTN